MILRERRIINHRRISDYADNTRRPQILNDRHFVRIGGIRQLAMNHPQLVFRGHGGEDVHRYPGAPSYSHLSIFHREHGVKHILAINKTGESGRVERSYFIDGLNISIFAMLEQSHA